MADNEGLDTWDFRNWRAWRRPFPYVLSPGLRVLSWVALVGWGGLIITAFVRPAHVDDYAWLLYWIGFIGSVVTLTRDAVGRRLRRRHRTEAHDHSPA